MSSVIVITSLYPETCINHWHGWTLNQMFLEKNLRGDCCWRCVWAIVTGRNMWIWRVGIRRTSVTASVTGIMCICLAEGLNAKCRCITITDSKGHFWHGSLLILSWRDIPRQACSVIGIIYQFSKHLCVVLTWTVILFYFVMQFDADVGSYRMLTSQQKWNNQNKTKWKFKNCIKIRMYETYVSLLNLW